MNARLPGRFPLGFIPGLRGVLASMLAKVLLTASVNYLRAKEGPMIGSPISVARPIRKVSAKLARAFSMVRLEASFSIFGFFGQGREVNTEFLVGVESTTICSRGLMSIS